MKKYVILAITLVCFITLLVGCSTEDTKVFKLRNVNSIVLKDNATEGSVTIVDKDTVSTLVNNFNNLSIKSYREIIPAKMGIGIIFKDADGNIIEGIYIFGKTMIFYSGRWYDVMKGTIDFDLIKTQLEKQLKKPHPFVHYPELTPVK